MPPIDRSAHACDDIVRPDDRVVMIVGNYGSGKTEVAVNLCLHLARRGRRVQIADLDIVNPYFRCREAGALMEAHGIRVVVPPGDQAWADLPIVLPEIRGLLHPPADTITVFDVGGDDVGARVLASLRTSIADGEYELWQVINAKRPFTDTADGCLAMRRAIESASRLTVTGLLLNSHLIDQTTPDTVLDGWTLAREVSARASLPVRAVSVMAHLADEPSIRAIDAPLLRLERHLLPPWLPPGRSTRPFQGDLHGQNRH
jgi:CobQ/CobB/MinD/ParA family nucleotide binding protein